MAVYRNRINATVIGSKNMKDAEAGEDAQKEEDAKEEVAEEAPEAVTEEAEAAKEGGMRNFIRPSIILNLGSYLQCHIFRTYYAHCCRLALDTSYWNVTMLD